MKNYLKYWDFMRVMRLIIGVFILIQGIVMGDVPVIALGGLFALFAVINMGCCGRGACNRTLPATNEEAKDISYEKVH